MDEINGLKAFSAEEANRILPKLTDIIHELQGKQQEILAKEAEIDALEILYPADVKGQSSEPVSREIDLYNGMLGRFYGLLDEVQNMGCFIKDLELGLVDFYSLYQGKVVYLCWRLGEPEVGFWHEVGRGYAYRQPLLRENEKESSG